MATKKTKSATQKASSSGEDTHITRIKAASVTPKKEKKIAKETIKETQKPLKREKARFGWLRAIGSYFKGAWYELRQVRWPNRRATWSLTGAVLAFTALFVILIVLLDAGFKLLFEQLLG